MILNCGYVFVMECCKDLCRFDCIEMIEKEVFGCRYSVLLECLNIMENFICLEKIEKYCFFCGYLVFIECFKDLEVVFCDVLVLRFLECGYVSEFKCSEKNIRCMEKVIDFF